MSQVGPRRPRAGEGLAGSCPPAPARGSPGQGAGSAGASGPALGFCESGEEAVGAAGGRGPERSPRPRTPRPGPGFYPAGGSLPWGHRRGVTIAGSPPRGHRRGVTAVGSPPWVPGNAARSACLCPLDRARQTPGSGLGSGDHRESEGSPRGEPRVLAGPVLGAEGRTIRTTEAGGLWAEAPRRPQAGGSGGGCGQLASDCLVSPGKTLCQDRTGTSTLALTTRPSPAPSAPQGPRPAPGEPPSGATCHSARPACPCFGRSPRVRGGEPTAPSQHGDVE